MSSTSTSAASRLSSDVPARSSKSQVLALVLSWTAVGLPLAWGVWETLRKALALFQ